MSIVYGGFIVYSWPVIAAPAVRESSFSRLRVLLALLAVLVIAYALCRYFAAA